PPSTVEHQTLFRTAEGTTRALASMGWPVRDYVPLGDLIPGMAYLVRRILENSSQVGFLLQSRSGESADRLLRSPESRFQSRDSAGQDSTLDLGPWTLDFRNQPPRRLFLRDEREAFEAALKAVREEFGREFRLQFGRVDARVGRLQEVRDP